MVGGYNWSGDTIIRDTIMWDKRAVLGYPSVYIPTDIREWVCRTDSEVISRAIAELDLPTTRGAGTFDLRAWMIWKYVAKAIEYIEDKNACGIDDFWQFPEETLTLKKGDCEDASFLLATLLLATGISEQCVRVILGKVITEVGNFGHAWVVYQNESGVWCLLEATLDSVPESLVPADICCIPGTKNQYQPQFCLNSSHMWWISPVKASLADYVKIRETKACGTFRSAF